jgi:tRNA-(ms[2]io[6]A)-hydroxylase
MMSRLAREELVHHEQVMRLMKNARSTASAVRRALRLGLRKVVRSHEPVKLVDTLVVGALSARSCERFERWCRIWTKSWASSISACSK